MLKFNLPLLWDRDYVAWLNGLDDLHSVYFNLPTSLIPDARVNSNFQQYTDVKNYLSLLSKRTKKYLTLNSRFTPLSYWNKQHLTQLINVLLDLKSSNLLDGILYLDAYLLTYLLTTTPTLATLDFIPSINTMSYSLDAINRQLTFIQNLIGKLPTTFVLDRSLNRNLEQLINVSTYLKHQNILVEVLVNEGCLLHCPYKINHDLLISQFSDQSIAFSVYTHSIQPSIDIYNANTTLGCLKDFKNNPSEIIKSPFIRPEDIKYLDEYVDIIKISGKVKTPQFVYNVYNAYKSRTYDENLLSLLDTTQIFEQDLYISNNLFPKDFFFVTSTCQKNCWECKYCEQIFEKVHFGQIRS